MSFESLMKDREARFNSPGFKAEMVREKAEFISELKNAGDSAKNFVWEGLIKKVLGKTISYEAKTAFNGKYNMVNSLGNATKNVAGAGLLGLKAVGNLARLIGKGTKIGARYLVAK